MAFSLNKRKTLEAAQKYVQKGAYDKALKEYQRLLQADPRDTNVRLKIGDVQLKKGDTHSAIRAYGEVAQQFSREGFDAKAVAIYKQVLRIDEKYLDAHVQLGDHFQRMGLVSDALRSFQEAIKICEASGLQREAFDLLKRVASLDPGNVPNRLGLADLLLRQQLADEAREEYRSLLGEVHRQEAWEDVLRVGARMRESFPDDAGPLGPMALAHISMGRPEGAVALLRSQLPKFPDDIELRNALVKVYEATGDAASAGTVYREIAELYKRRGDDAAARDILQRYVPVQEFGELESDTPPSILLDELSGTVGELTLGAHEDSSVEEDVLLSEPVQAPIPTPVPAPAPAFVGGAVRVTDLLAEARVSIEFDDWEDAEQRMRRALELEPANAEARALLQRVVSRRAGSAPAPAAAPPPLPTPAPPEIDFPDDGDTLPDVELILEDGSGEDDAFASVEPPMELLRSPGTEPVAPVVVRPRAAPVAPVESQEPIALPPPAPAEPEPSADADEPAEVLEFEIDIDDAPSIPEFDLDSAPAPLRPELHPEEAPLELDSPLESPTEELPRVLAEETAGGVTFSDLLEEVEDEDAALGEEDAFDLAALLEEEEEEQPSSQLQQIFAAFKRGIQEQLGPEECEAHYDLAIAYKEMGLVEDALRELEIVREGERHQLEVLSLMATCKLELGRAREAVADLEAALALCGDVDDSALAVRYDLGLALLAAGRKGEARESFQKVAAADPAYREVSQMIQDCG